MYDERTILIKLAYKKEKRKKRKYCVAASFSLEDISLYYNMNIQYRFCMINLYKRQNVELWIEIKVTLKTEVVKIHFQNFKEAFRTSCHGRRRRWGTKALDKVDEVEKGKE